MCHHNRTEYYSSLADKTTKDLIDSIPSVNPLAYLTGLTTDCRYILDNIDWEEIKKILTKIKSR